MYLHLGNNIVVKENDIVGVFDLDKTSIEQDTRDFLQAAEKSGEVINVSMELPKSFCVCTTNKENKQKVYISQISTPTLLKRTRFIKTL